MTILIQKINSVVARNHQQILHAICQLLPHLYPDRVDQRLLTHRLHNATGSKHRDTSHDSKPWIKSLCRQLHTRWDTDHHRQFSMVMILFADSFQIFPNHLAGHLIDGSSSHQLFQSRLCHPANTNASINDDLCFICRLPADFRIDQDSIGHIWIIASILLNRTADCIVLTADIQHFQPKIDSLRSMKLHIRNLFA